MKKAILFISGVVLASLFFSFSLVDDNEKIIKITADEIAEFDMVQNGIVTEGVKTPYEFKFKGKDGKFIFRSKIDDKKLNMSVEGKMTKVTANWEVIVLLVEDGELLTFGMD
jgi:hypothetical protein